MNLNNDFEHIETKYSKLIELAKEIMVNIDDKEHDINHMYDVVDFTKTLLSKINIKVNIEVCIISAYWHDVGRAKIVDGHEKESANMLKEAMLKMGYDTELIDECYKAIEFHKWSMIPTTNEGLVVRDADKLAWLGKRRWNNCIINNKKLDSIIKLLPKLRNQILVFPESREIYDNEIVNILEIIYCALYNNPQ